MPNSEEPLIAYIAVDKHVKAIADDYTADRILNPVAKDACAESKTEKDLAVGA
jgi:hypothetical protein